MRRVVVLSVMLVFTGSVFGVKITPFTDTEGFVERARDIVIAECLEFPAGKDAGLQSEELTAATVRVERIIKGDRKTGKLRIATHYPLKQGARYLLTSLGGEAKETSFLTTAELSVVPLPDRLDFARLENKTVEQQVEILFQEGLRSTILRIEQLEQQAGLLQQAISRPGSERVAVTAPAALVRPSRERTAWIASCLKDINVIQTGMTRADLLKRFTTEGGVYTATWGHYVWRGCPYIKVDVEFKLAGKGDQQSPEDAITKISKPYLEFTIAD